MFEERRQEEPTWEKLILKLSEESNENLKEYKQVLIIEGVLSNFIN